MASISLAESSGLDAGRLAIRLNRRLLWLAIGTMASLLASGGRFDLALAAWIAPVFVLRFSRTSGLALAIAGVVAASSLQIVGYMVEIAAPFNLTILALCPILGAIFALPYILDRLFASRLGDFGCVILMPLATVLIEFAAASLLPVGASIGTQAITQSGNLALVQIISVFGPYVIGFLIALAATVSNQIWEKPSREAWLSYGVFFALLLLGILVFGQARLVFANTYSPGKTVKVAGVVPPMALRAPAWADVSMATFPPAAQTRAALATSQMKAAYGKVQNELLAETSAAAESGAKIIVWSETAAPVLQADKGALLGKVSALARKNHIYVDAAIGVPYERNETFLIDPQGRQEWHYRKNHPVPGMEPVAPFKDAPPVVDTPYGRLTNVICYDGDFPALMRVRADIMLLPGWDWPEAGYFHTMKSARLRAIENGYSLVRVDYDGVSAAFDPFGRVLAMQDTVAGNAYVMITDIPIRGVATIYNRTGDLFAWLCVIAALGLCVFGILRPVKRRS